jgi:sugar/nucleoside kinase (ribokinase family)
MAKFDVVGLGACGIDYNVKVHNFSDDLNKVICSNLRRSEGGVTANNLVQASRLGLKVAYCGMLGNDSESIMLLESFKKDNIWPITLKRTSTQFCWIIVNKHGEHQVYVFPNASLLLTPAIVDKYFKVAIENSRHFHTEVNVIPLKAAIKGAEIAKRGGSKVFLDIDNDPFRLIREGNIGTLKELKRLIGLADVLKMSQSAAKELVGENLESSIKKLSKNHEFVAITQGGKGCYMASRGKVEFCPGVKTKIVDTTGAGDAFMGGLSYAILKGMKLKDIGMFANACGAFCCRDTGARTSGRLKDIRKIL